MEEFTSEALLINEEVKKKSSSRVSCKLCTCCLFICCFILSFLIIMITIYYRGFFVDEPIPTVQKLTLSSNTILINSPYTVGDQSDYSISPDTSFVYQCLDENIVLLHSSNSIESIPDVGNVIMYLGAGGIFGNVSSQFPANSTLLDPNNSDNFYYIYNISTANVLEVFDEIDLTEPVNVTIADDILTSYTISAVTPSEVENSTVPIIQINENEIFFSSLIAGRRALIFPANSNSLPSIAIGSHIYSSGFSCDGLLEQVLAVDQLSNGFLYNQTNIDTLIYTLFLQPTTTDELAANLANFTQIPPTFQKVITDCIATDSRPGLLLLNSNNNSITQANFLNSIVPGRSCRGPVLASVLNITQSLDLQWTIIEIKVYSDIASLIYTLSDTFDVFPLKKDSSSGSVDYSLQIAKTKYFSGTSTVSLDSTLNFNPSLTPILELYTTSAKLGIIMQGELTSEVKISLSLESSFQLPTTPLFEIEKALPRVFCMVGDVPLWFFPGIKCSVAATLSSQSTTTLEYDFTVDSLTKLGFTVEESILNIASGIPINPSQVTWPCDASFTTNLDKTVSSTCSIEADIEFETTLDISLYSKYALKFSATLAFPAAEISISESPSCADTEASLNAGMVLRK